MSETQKQKMPETQKGYLVIDGKNIQVITNLEEVLNLEFETVEDTNNLTIFEIEFKKKIKFKAKVKLDVSE